jgi:hypothetical protein
MKQMVWPRSWIVLALTLVGMLMLGAALEARRDAARMAEAAEAFLAGLTSDQRGRTEFGFDSDERFRWHFIPPESFPRNGLPLKDMSADQRERAHDLLRSGLSARGYLTATQVLELEAILRDMQRGGRMARDPDEYHFSVFGTLSRDGTWAWRIEGHHLSLHFTIVDGSAVASAPAFIGANPAEVRQGPQRGLRPLGREEDAARRLLRALDDDQRTIAIVDDVAPRDIATGNQLEVDPLTPIGIRADQLDASQRALLMSLIEVYTSVMADDVAAQRTVRLQAAGLETIAFAWAGGLDRGMPHYYRVQGPTFLIEYDNTQNDANHIHSVWREFEGDFGRDLLREHLHGSHHADPAEQAGSPR